MIKEDIIINSEYSAQGRNHSTSPGLVRLINKSKILGSIGNDNCVVDYGCGKLRNFEQIKKFAQELYLVDTKIQLSRNHTEQGKLFDYNDFLEKNSNGVACKLMDNINFQKLNINCDLIFSIAVADIIPLESYATIIKDSFEKLRKDGYLVLVVPRNDTSILRRCNKENSYKLGNVFRKGKYCTYMRNYRDSKPLFTEVEKYGFSLEEDLSIFNQICTIFRKN
jgi:SAM-dependent methyltransferase